MTPTERIKLYNNTWGEKYPDSKLWVGESGRVYGMWFFGNDYRNKSTLYGTYPKNYLPRITTLFPDKPRVVHLFAGDVPASDEYVRVDINPERNPDICGDAEQLSSILDYADLIYADPPYSVQDSELHYGTPMVNRNKVVKEAAKVVSPGGFLVWMDQVWPMYRKDEWNLWGSIGLVRSTNHRFRVVTIFERLP